MIEIDLARIFQSVAEVLAGHRQDLNLADEVNHNHGDHMVEIFQVAARAGEEMADASLADAMDYAAGLLRQLQENGSAQVYARGLGLLAAQFRQRQLELGDLMPVVQSYLGEKKESSEGDSHRSGEVLKALLAALAEWEQVEASLQQPAPGKASSGLDMGYLFGVGMAYLQAKQKGGERIEILSDTVVSASPLGSAPHRRQSGVIAVQALLRAMSD